MMSHPATQLPPGFRFYPTDEELIVHYLRNRAVAPLPSPSIIAEVDIYKFDPWDLPEKAMFGDQEWYFFTPRDRKYPNGLRPNRAAVSGYWKATGSDKLISSGCHNVGVKKALVFYKGRPLKGVKTNWIMHEYRLPDSLNRKTYISMSTRVKNHSMKLDDWVLCRIYKKNCHLPPPMIDQEQEDSHADDACFHTESPPHQHPLLNFPETPFTSEILEDYSQLFNFDKNPFFDQPISWLQQTNHSNGGNGYLLPLLSQVESQDSIVLKRQKHDDRNNSEQSGESLSSSKKQCESNIFQSFSSQFDSSQYSLLSQNFFSQQLLLNSQLGEELHKCQKYSFADS